MITKAFAVYDSKALCFGVPFFMPSVGAAVRAFGDTANDSQSQLNRHPGDFVLFQIGEFDDEKGVMRPLMPHVHLGLALDFVEKKRVPMPVASMAGVQREVAEAVLNPLATNGEIGEVS